MWEKVHGSVQEVDAFLLWSYDSWMWNQDANLDRSHCQVHALRPLPSAAGSHCTWLWRVLFCWFLNHLLHLLPLWMCEHSVSMHYVSFPTLFCWGYQGNVEVGKGRKNWVQPRTSLCLFLFFQFSPFSKCGPWLQRASPYLIRSLLLRISLTLTNVW